MLSFNSTLAEEAGVAPFDLSKLTGPLVQLQSYILESGDRLVFMQLIGCFLGLILYGILCDQVYIYYISFPNDNLTSRTVVYLLWLTETVQTVTNIYYTFHTFCDDFGNLSRLDDVHIVWFNIIVLSGFVGCIAQLFYVWRMYKLSKKARWLCVIVSAIAFTQFAAAICCGIQVRNSGHYSNLHKNSKLRVTAIIWLGGSTLCDTAIALCMTHLLGRAQKSIRKLPSRLIQLSIETGTVTAAIATVHVALFLFSQNNNYHIVPANCLVKIYSNTVLAVCNNRITRRIRGGREDTTPQSFDSFDLSIGGFSIKPRDTETNINASSSRRSAQGYWAQLSFFKHWLSGGRVGRKANMNGSA
ncbi:hypothetical protein EDD85DRAFT_972123 [Armillaria nabsnona]|nr:hypothetical protein EDD85DRAFT_972123 [Armillaria nabsnona]